MAVMSGIVLFTVIWSMVFMILLPVRVQTQGDLGQIVEGNLLTPKLVGNSVGLHPVWLLLALSVFGTLFGFVGLLVAVPVAAAIGVIARFATARYRESVLYMGREPETTVDEDIR